MGKILGLKEIKKILSQRHPLLMLDRVEIVSDKSALGVKNLSINEAFFQGHFPGHPIMPGVLQIEAMKQLGEILARPLLDPENRFDIYMRVVEKVKFRRPNFPGDRMKITCDITEVNNGEVIFNATACNASGITSEAVITLALREPTVELTMPQLFGEFDKGEDTALDVGGIMKIIPHRFPFLLIDNAAIIRDGGIVVTKNLTGNEDYFIGNPDMPLPESLQCEMVAQSGCVYVLSRPGFEGKLGYFLTIDRAEFFAPVYPGDRLICDLRMPPPASRFGKSTGDLRVGDKVIMTITMMFAIVDDPNKLDD